MQKSEFPKMRHYIGFWQIGSHMVYAVYLAVTLMWQFVESARQPFSEPFIL